MIRFRVLFDLYTREEDEAKLELGRRERARADLVAERQRVEQGLLGAAHGLDPAQHELYLAWWQSEQRRLAAYGQRIREAEQAIEDARGALAEAHRRRSTIAKLRERDREHDRQRAERREQRSNDDRAGARHLATAGTRGG